MKALRQNLLLQFNILCFIVMLVVAFAMAILINSEMQHQEELLNKIVLEMTVMDTSSEGLVAGMNSKTDSKTMESGHNHNHAQALTPAPTETQHTNHSKHSDHSNHSNLPDSDGGATNIHSATLSEIRAHNVHLKSRTLLTLIIGFIFLYFALTGIVWKSWRTINSQQLRFQDLVESMREGLLMTNVKNEISYANSRMSELLNLDSEQLKGKHVNTFFSNQSLKQTSFETELKSDSESIWLDVKSNPYTKLNGSSNGYLYTVNDITERKRIEKQIQHDAFHDTLTDTPNRALFLDRLTNAIERYHREEKTSYAVLFLDFDRFKIVNDSLGHTVGDTLLKAISKRLDKHLRRGDTLARLGGDEFTILLEDVESISDVTDIAENIQSSLEHPFKIAEHLIHISASIGIVANDLDYDSPEDVLRDADIAMYRAKALGKARFEFFTEEMRQNAAKLLVLENDLRIALDEEQFDIHYQPIAELLDDNVVGFEALARWNHPSRGMISPAEFIPIAEDTGLIIALDRWILKHACKKISEWQNELNFKPPIMLSVNFSSRQFDTNDLVSYVESVLEETGFNPPDLKIEITEQIFMANTDNIEKTLHELKALGVKLYIDDFGTGYSSLSYLQRFPVDTLKIDRCFITNMIEDSESSELVRAIISMAHNLGLQVVAEGIENQGQMQQLKVYNCDYMQGFHLSKPLAQDAARAFLIEHADNQQFRNPESLSQNNLASTNDINLSN